MRLISSGTKAALRFRCYSAGCKSVIRGGALDGCDGRTRHCRPAGGEYTSEASAQLRSRRAAERRLIRRTSQWPPALCFGLIIQSSSYLAAKLILPLMSKFKDYLKSIFPSTPFGVVLAILICLLVAGYSIWYTSAGEFPAFPKTGKDNYYVDLGEAFMHGQLSMLQKPSPELVALKNPYGFKQRANVDYQFDYSYYKGKYYLYWGPVPGLVLGGIEEMIHARPPNSLMTIISYIGLSFLLLMILIQIRSQFFPAAPSLSLMFFILCGLVNIPFLFLLGRPEIYETSIIAGQLFLFLGLSSWLMYTKKNSPIWLVIAGLGWGLALGSRYNLAISILLFVGFTIIWIRQENKDDHFLIKLWPLLVPLALCVLGLGLYNFARFQNPLETGLNLSTDTSHAALIFGILSAFQHLRVFLFPSDDSCQISFYHESPLFECISSSLAQICGCFIW